MPNTFPKSRQLHGPAAYRRVYDGRVRESRGPFTIYSLPNSLPYFRLGLSLPRAVGTNVVRNRIKRMFREAFRQMQLGKPGFDLIVTVRKHLPMELVDYQQILSGVVGNLERKHKA